MAAPSMSSLDWSAIVARAQAAVRLRRWAELMAEWGDESSARSLRLRACEQEARVVLIARNCGVML